jgi:hypothetical protein
MRFDFYKREKLEYVWRSSVSRGLEESFMKRRRSSFKNSENQDAASSSSCRDSLRAEEKGIVSSRVIQGAVTIILPPRA